MITETTFEIERLHKGYLIEKNGSEKTGINNEDDLESSISKLLSNEAGVKDLLYYQGHKRVVIKISVECFE